MGPVRPGVNEPGEGGFLHFLGRRMSVFAIKAEKGKCKFSFYAFSYHIFPGRVSDFRLKGESLPLKALGGVTPYSPYAHLCLSRFSLFNGWLTDFDK